MTGGNMRFGLDKPFLFDFEDIHRIPINITKPDAMVHIQFGIPCIPTDERDTSTYIEELKDWKSRFSDRNFLEELKDIMKNCGFNSIQSEKYLNTMVVNIKSFPENLQVFIDANKELSLSVKS